MLNLGIPLLVSQDRISVQNGIGYMFFHHQQLFSIQTVTSSCCSVGVSNGFMLELASLICQTNKSMSPVSAQIYLKYSRSSGSIVTVWDKRKIAGGENCH